MARKKNIDFNNKLEELSELILSEKNKDEITTIPTGSISLDISLGTGGVPLGRFSEIYGAESTGKTTLALSICKNAINLGYRVLYDDVEQALDLDFVKSIVDNYSENSMVIVRPETMEQALGIAESAIKSKEFGLVVLDSIGSLAPLKVKEDELTDSNVALLSRMLTVFVQRNAYELRYSNTAFLGVNQVRDKIGSYYPTLETPGGHSWKHILSVRIQLSKLSDIEVGDDKIGIMTKFVVKKNKLAPPFRTFSFPIIFGKGVDSLRDLVEFATTIGILEKGGPYYKFRGETLASGLVGTTEYLKQNKDILDNIVNACYNVSNTKLIREEDLDE